MQVQVQAALTTTCEQASSTLVIDAFQAGQGGQRCYCTVNRFLRYRRCTKARTSVQCVLVDLIPIFLHSRASGCDLFL